MSGNADLAAALFYAIGGDAPHAKALEAQAKALALELEGRETVLHKVAELCEPQETPQECYLSVKAYSWLGARYARKTMEAAEKYLAGPPWEELPNRNVKEDGIVVDQIAACRASVVRDLAKAQQSLSYLDKALENYNEAFRLEPHSAMNAIKAADVIARQSGKAQALTFLRAQRKSAYFTPVKYTDASGQVCRNSLFKDLLNAHILKLEQEQA